MPGETCAIVLRMDTTRKNRQTGTSIMVGRNDGEWFALCVDHCDSINADTKAIRDRLARTPGTWCQGCIGMMEIVSLCESIKADFPDERVSLQAAYVAEEWVLNDNYHRVSQDAFDAILARELGE